MDVKKFERRRIDWDIQNCPIAPVLNLKPSIYIASADFTKIPFRDACFHFMTMRRAKRQWFELTVYDPVAWDKKMPDVWDYLVGQITADQYCKFLLRVKLIFPYATK